MNKWVYAIILIVVGYLVGVKFPTVGASALGKVGL